MPKAVVIICILVLGALLTTEAHCCERDYDYTVDMGCTYNEPDPETMEMAREVGRISAGIQRVFGERYYLCGKKFEGEEMERATVSIAYHIVNESRRVGIDHWGLAGTIANESGFDLCAIGIHPRRWAVKNGLLKKRRLSISYSMKEVMSVIDDHGTKMAFARTGIDLGPCQLLTRFYLDGRNKASDMMELDKGIAICADEMARRGERHRTDEPWLYWRGKATQWYADKIERWMRRLGKWKQQKDER